MILREEHTKHIQSTGTTGVLAIVLNGVVTVANIGDSRIIAVENRDGRVKGISLRLLRHSCHTKQNRTSSFSL